MANLKTEGEWGFLNRLLPRLRRFGRERFVVPPGDDAAVLKTPFNTVLSIDGLTEGTHFKSNWAPAVNRLLGVGLGRALGWKLMGSGLSDLAAMGRTTSRWAMVYVAAPTKTNMAVLMDLYRGVREICAAHNVALAGGDTVRGRDLSLVVAVGGQSTGRPLARSGAKPGDALCVLGSVGDAHRGLRILLGHQRNNQKADQKYFVGRFFKAVPRFKEAALLAGFSGVTSLMDLSDPLSSSVRILAASSGVGARVQSENLPVSSRLKKYGVPPPALLSAGEDYGLLFTVRASRVSSLKKKMRFSVIGTIQRRSQGVHFYFQNKRVGANEFFEHFA